MVNVGKQAYDFFYGVNDTEFQECFNLFNPFRPQVAKTISLYITYNLGSIHFVYLFTNYNYYHTPHQESILGSLQETEKKKSII